MDLYLKYKNNIILPKLKYEHALHEKMPKFEENNQIKLLDGHSSTLKFLSCKTYLYLLFWSDDTIFSHLVKNTLKKI